MFKWECRTWARPILKNSLVKFLRQELPPYSTQRHTDSILAKEVREGCFHLLKRWHSDLAIVTLLVKALEKMLDLAGYGKILANELTKEKRRDECILHDLQELFSMEAAKCELQSSIVRLFSRLLDLGKAALESDYNYWRRGFIEMVLSLMASNRNAGNIAELCFHLLNETLVDQAGIPGHVLLEDKTQVLLVDVCTRHASSGKHVYSSAHISKIYLLPNITKEFTKSI